MNTLALRLAHALEVRNKSPAELARATKKTESAVSQWLSGETKSMRGDSLMAACIFLSCRPEWLASNSGISGLEVAAVVLSDGDSEKTAPLEFVPQKPGIRYVAKQLADMLVELDQDDRELASVALKNLALRPDDPQKMIDRLGQLLGEIDSQEPPLRSTGT